MGDTLCSHCTDSRQVKNAFIEPSACSDRYSLIGSTNLYQLYAVNTFKLFVPVWSHLASRCICVHFYIIYNLLGVCLSSHATTFYKNPPLVH